jgi:hypothetical protein
MATNVVDVMDVICVIYPVVGISTNGLQRRFLSGAVIRNVFVRNLETM